MTARIVELAEETTTPQNNGPTIFIATPAYGCILTIQFLQCLLQTQLSLSSKGIGIIIDMLGNESLITRARNLLTKRFLQSNATHMLFIDADISWDPEAILRLLKKDEGVVTTSYPKKFLDWSKLESRLSDPDNTEPLQQVALDFNLNVTEREVQVVDGFAKVLDAATGFMLVKRDAIEQMYSHYQKELLVVNDLLGASQQIPNYVALFDCMIDPVTKRSLSEDFAFSRRWQAMGNEVYMDLLMPLGHTGGFHYEGDIGKRLTAPGGAQTLMRTATAAPDVETKFEPPGGRPTVLLAILPHDDKVSLGFVMTLTRLVAALQIDNRYAAQVKCFNDKNEACDFMWGQPSYRSLLLLDGLLSFEPAMVLSMISSNSPLEVAVPPEPTYNWNVVAQETTEHVKTRGLEYQVQMMPQGKDALVAPLDLAKIDRCVLERLVDALDARATYGQGKKRIWFHTGVHEDRKLSEDEMFCRLWGSGITLNVEYPVTKLANMTFAGVVMARKQIR